MGRTMEKQREEEIVGCGQMGEGEQELIKSGKGKDQDNSLRKLNWVLGLRGME